MNSTGVCIVCGKPIATHVDLWRHWEEQQQSTKAAVQMEQLYKQAINTRYRLPSFSWRR